mmetsp:Transcript_15220/g.42912  ORF Transcript_15220/g.42912 Transcript_15220/m.42912 type:complete len:547 (-) Transcript_15220:215-1855(-)
MNGHAAGSPQEEPLEELIFSRDGDGGGSMTPNGSVSMMNGQSTSATMSRSTTLSHHNSTVSAVSGDDNDLTASLLSNGGSTGGGGNHGNGSGNNGPDDEGNNQAPMTASHFVSAATRQHSSVRLVLRKIGNFVATFTLLAMLVIIPIVTYRQLRRRKLDFAAFESAGVMVFGTVILSIRLVYLHFTHWYMPNIQKYIIRILWMVPLYAIQSWLSLRFRSARIYIDTIRDLYEAYVISSFVYYLIELLGGQDALVRTLRRKVTDDGNGTGHLAKHSFPLNFVLQPWELGMEFMMQTKHGVLQYVVVKTIATFLTFGFQSLEMYGEGEFRWDVAYPYMAFLLNCSVMYALYCLVMFFHVVSEDLRYPINWHPLGKFLCVKGVVFFTWWQGVVIFYLQSHGIIEDIGQWSGEEVANGLIDYCVCIEMVFFAIAHAYTFTYTEYLPSTVQEAIEAAAQAESAAVEGGPPPPRRRTSSAVEYQPPTVLNQPLNFRDAFWSSTLPSETIHDIRRLRRGVDRVVNQATDPGTISMQHVDGDQLEVEDAEQAQE